MNKIKSATHRNKIQNYLTEPQQRNEKRRKLKNKMKIWFVGDQEDVMI